MDVLVAHKLTPPEPPTGRCPDANIPPEVEALVLAALAKHPDDRPASMTDLARELSRLAAHRAGATTPPPVTPLPAVRPMPTPLLTPAPSAPTLPGEEQRVPHRSRAPLVLLLVVLLAGGVLAYFSYPAAAPGLDPAATAAIPVAEPREPAIVIPPAPMPDPPPSAVATKVSLASVPSGASVTSGGKALGVTPLEVELAGDKARTVRLSLKGYKTVKRKLAPGVAAVEVRLAKARAGEEDDGIGKLNDLKDDPYE
jgi:serine/threonine-protein kinase